MVNFPPITAEIRPIAHLMKIADEHESRNIVVCYWARMAACRLALQLVPGKKSPQTSELLRVIIDWLEETKKANSDNDGITNQTSAQALIEEYALKLFEHADNLDKSEVFNKNTVKTFYTAGLMIDILEQFESLDDEFKEKRKYAKWKAAYIHNCLKNGEVPIAGPRDQVAEDEDMSIHKSDINDQDVKNYTDYGISDPSSLPSTSNVPFDRPRSSGPDHLNLGESGNSQVPSTSPVTPLLPTNPTPFNTPNPQVSPIVTPQIIPSIKPSINNNTGFVPNPEQVQKAQKYCKYAASALNYDDTKNAIDYLTKALQLLQTGEEY